MPTDHVPVPDQYIQTVKTSGRPLFDLGQVVATPAVLAHLDKHGVYPSVLLSQHCHGDWGVVGADDAKCNNEAIHNDGRIVSAYDVEGARIWVITEAKSDAPNRQRASTCLMFPDEY
jgi:hypothetical protein